MTTIILYHHCSPHQVHLVTEAQAYFRSQGSQLISVELYGGLADYSWTAQDKVRPKDWVCLFPNKKKTSTGQLFQAIRRVLKQHQADVMVLNGWYDRITWALAAARKLLGCKLVIVSDSVAWDYERSWHKELMKKCLMSCMDAGFVAGTPQRDYLHSLGMRPDQMTMGNDAVDNSMYSSIPLRILPGNRTIHIGTAARLVPIKNLATAMQAFAAVTRLFPNDKLCWHLAGTGPLEVELQSQAKELQVSVQFHGFVNYTQMPEFYRNLDIYWQPSLREPWGLVVNEAMASGLPVMVSDRCGCAIDLVKPEVGWVHDTTQQGMVQAWSRSLLARDHWPAMGASARELISHWDSNRYARGLYDACVLSRRTPILPDALYR